MEMQLKITKQCGRCGKVEEYIGDLEDAQMRNDQVQTRKNTAKHLDGVVQELARIDEPPPIVVMLLDPETRTYVYKTLYDLCDKKNTKEGQRRGCAARVADLVADIFNTKKETVKPKKRKSSEVDKNQTSLPLDPEVAI